MGNPGVPYEGNSRVNPNMLHPHNCDPYYSKHCGNAGSMPPGAASGTGNALANIGPLRMKKMKKK